MYSSEATSVVHPVPCISNTDQFMDSQQEILQWIILFYQKVDNTFLYGIWKYVGAHWHVLFTHTFALPFFLISSETGELVWDQVVLALLFEKHTICVLRA